MTSATRPWLRQIEHDGYALVPEVFGGARVTAMLRDLTAALRPEAEETSVRTAQGSVYAARNVLRVWPPAAGVWREPVLRDALAAVLGPAFGLVRALFFDKPPERSWSLPWHKDLTVAVRDNRLPSRHFAKPTRKAGVPHVEAPEGVLRAMLAARVHLDDVTEENGPLKVVPGSHRSGKRLAAWESPPVSILCRRGDVLLIRPLVAHCSNNARPDTRRHRRVLHLEFAASPDLPDGYAWHDFLPA
jgi:ectoine hydroxylase-related dioxygenase (phytanoyl-CoA dioxygenase family)